MSVGFVLNENKRFSKSINENMIVVAGEKSDDPERSKVIKVLI